MASTVESTFWNAVVRADLKSVQLGNWVALYASYWVLHQSWGFPSELLRINRIFCVSVRSLSSKKISQSLIKSVTLVLLSYLAGFGTDTWSVAFLRALTKSSRDMVDIVCGGATVGNDVCTASSISSTLAVGTSGTGMYGGSLYSSSLWTDVLLDGRAYRWNPPADEVLDGTMVPLLA